MHLQHPTASAAAMPVAAAKMGTVKTAAALKVIAQIPRAHTIKVSSAKLIALWLDGAIFELVIEKQSLI